MRKSQTVSSYPKLIMNDILLRKYELMVIFSGELLEADFEKALGETKQMLKENSKEIFYEETWGKKDFAYRIKKQKRGYYVIFDFTAEAKNLAEIRSSIKLNPHVLRHLLITVPDDYEPEGYKKLITLKEETPEEKPTTKEIPEARVATAVTENLHIEQKAAEETPAEKETKKPKIAGKEEEDQLKTVEKRLERILENPDIDIR